MAHQRSDRKAAWDVYRAQSRAGKPSIVRHNFGILAEWAVAQLLGVGIDLNIYPKGDGGRPDLFTHTGSGVCVKGRTERQYHGQPADLALQNTEASGIHQLGVLVYPHREGIVDVMGWCTADEFRRLSTIENYTYGPRRAIGLQHLQPIETLLQILNLDRAERLAKTGQL